MLSIITVMVVLAYGFLRQMQMSHGTSQVQRRHDLARLAAEMGMQHAMAACLDEYSMTAEVRDAATVAPVTRLDSPTRNVFNLLSPRDPVTSAYQPPQDYDLAPDVPFQDLYSYWDGTYHYSTGMIQGFTHGWSTGRGYGRWFEGNRFDYDARTVYDPSSYDRYDPAAPDASVVASTFRPVDPFKRGAAVAKRHQLDNPLLLDADYRPVTNAQEARYRMRYAVAVTDMSASLWMNTDMPWLAPADQQAARTAYKDAVESVGAVISYDATMENVFLGHGAYGNSPMAAGVPTDWPERGGQPMAYRHPISVDNDRAYHCVLGSPAMRWNDPGGVWLGSALTSWYELAFSLQDWNSAWHKSPDSQGGQPRTRGDNFAQRGGTPFGRPYGTDTDHPWIVNALTVTPRVLQAMVTAYLPPASRSAFVTVENQWPFVTWVDTSGSSHSAWTSYSGPITPTMTATVGTWNIPRSSNLVIAGVGLDLFTDSFVPKGLLPFTYPTPTNRDYWTSPAAVRHDHNPTLDARTNDQRYPGGRFFTIPGAEDIATTVNSHASEMMVWSDVAADPRQLMNDPAQDPLETYPANVGTDHLARHIVFYKPDGGGTAPAASNNAKFLTVYNNLKVNNGTGMVPGNWISDFNPLAPYGKSTLAIGGDVSVNLYQQSSQLVYTPPVPVSITSGEVYPPLPEYPDPVGAAATLPQDRLPPPTPGRKLDPNKWQIRRGTGGNPECAVKQTYWQRLALAFYHTTFTAQVANLAWADSQDTRSQKLWYGTRQSNGITYDKTPDMANTAVRKGPVSRKHPSDPKTADRWDPAAAAFASPEQLDRQFLANLGESFDQPGRVTPGQALVLADPTTTAPRPPRYTRYLNINNNYPGPSSFGVGTSFSIAEYRVTNNIRTLLTPIDTKGGTIALTASSTVDQLGGNAPPRNLWLLDEWNAGAEAGYVPGTTPGARPTALARARAKLMERVLNDWRLSFLGATADYAPTFRPKDFDGDGMVFCSGYLAASAADADTGLTCWLPADGSGNGPGKGAGLTIYTVTGCLAFTRSNQFKIQVRGELFDNFIAKAVSEQYLESCILIDPDRNVVRGGLPGGLEDTQLIHQRPIHNYYRGYLDRSYP